MGDTAAQMELAAEIKESAAREGVEMWDLYTGMATHRFHGLAHSHPAMRQRMAQWILEACDLARAMGCTRWGGHVDAIPVETLGDPGAYQRAVASLYAQWRDLADQATEKGMTALYLEQMYIPSEVPWNLAQTAEALLAYNLDRPGCRIYTTVDVGHQAGQQYGMEPPDTDYLEWVRHYGAFSEVIHLQQTSAEGSHHWPFTDQYNAAGHIDMDEFMAALEEAHQSAGETPLADVLPPVREQRLILEVIPGSTKCEDQLLAELKTSHEYLSQWIPAEGLSWKV
jgi:sugar phosphate isomerase/epimerase